MRSRNNKAFTLIELLIVIGIIAILAAAVIVAINPGQQFAAARDATRRRNIDSVYQGVISRKVYNAGQWETNENCDPIPEELTEIGTADGNYDLFGCIAPDYISGEAFDPEGGDEENTGYYIARYQGEVSIVGQNDQRTGYLVAGSPILMEGSGTEDEPYEVRTVDHLQHLADYPDDYFVLVSNIDASDTENWNDGKGFEPVYFDGDNYDMTLDGDGYVIENLYINRPDESRVGIFGGSMDFRGTVKDVGLVDVDITGGTYTGAVAGRPHSAEFNNVFVEGVVDGGSQVGGMIGRSSSNTSIYNSYAKVEVLSSSSSSGGVVGHTSTVGSTFENIYSAGKAEGGSFAGVYDGGDETSNIYYDEDVAVSDDDNAVGLSTDQMTGDSAENNMNFDWENVWRATNSYPELQWE